MKYKINDDKELVTKIRVSLKDNKGYCPCVFNSQGKEEYKCPCKNFREKVPVGEICHCGLFIKTEI